MRNALERRPSTLRRTSSECRVRQAAKPAGADRHRFQLGADGLDIIDKRQASPPKRNFGLRGNRESVYRKFCEMHGLEVA